MPEYPIINRVVLYLFLLYVLVWYLQLGIRIHFLGVIRIEFILGVTLIIFAIIQVLKQKRVEEDSGITKYVIAYFVCLIISLLFSQDLTSSLFVFNNRVVKFSMMMVFIAVFIKRPVDMKLFIGTFLLACLRIGYESLIGTIDGSMMWQNQGVMRLHGTTPLYTHPNSLAGNALGTFPFIFFLFPTVPYFYKVILAVQAIFSANIILHSGSRTGYIGFLAFILIVFIKKKAKLKYALMAILITLIGIIIIPREYIERFESIYTGVEEGSTEGTSRELRIEIFRDAVKVIKKYPLGVGIAAFPKVRKAMFGREQDTHNLYTEILSNIGIQGFIVFTLLIYQTMKTLLTITYSMNNQIQKLNILKDKNDTIVSHNSDLLFCIAVAKSVYYFIIIRLIIGIFGHDLYEIYWWFAIGTTIALYHLDVFMHKKTEMLQSYYQ